MEKRIIEAKKGSALLPSTLKALKAIVSDKDNKARPVMSYVHYNQYAKRFEATNGRVMVLVSAAGIADEEREGFFSIAGNMLIEEEGRPGSYPNCDRCIPQNCDTVATVDGGFEKAEKEAGAYRIMRIALLTKRVFNAGAKWMIAAVESSPEWRHIEWNTNTSYYGAVKLSNSDNTITAVIMPMTTEIDGGISIEKKGEEKRKAI